MRCSSTAGVRRVLECSCLRRVVESRCRKIICSRRGISVSTRVSRLCGRRGPLLRSAGCTQPCACRVWSSVWGVKGRTGAPRGTRPGWARARGGRPGPNQVPGSTSPGGRTRKHATDCVGAGRRVMTARRAARASAAAEMGLVDAWELPGRTVPASAPRSTISRITWKRYCSRIHTLREARKRQHVLCLHKSWQPGALAGQGCSPDVATTETLQRIQLL